MRVQSVDVANLDDLEQPLELRLRYLIDGQLHESNGRLVTKLPALWEQNRLAVAAVQDRTHPFDLRWPVSVEPASPHVKLRFTYDQVSGSFAPDRYAALQSEVSSALAALGQPVVFERKR